MLSTESIDVSERLTKERRGYSIAVVATILAFLFIGAIALGWRP